MRKVRSRLLAAFALSVLFFGAGGCATYGVLDRGQTATVLGTRQEELKTPDQVRRARGR